MEIYILRDGKQTGPFSEEATQSLLKQGAIMINDLAWQPGLPQWLPLHAVLYPAAQPGSTPPAPPPNLAPPPMPLPSSPVKLPAEPAPTPVVVTPAPAAHPVTAKPASGPVGAPATPRQKAFLSYMGIPFSPAMSKEQAAMLANDAMENPKDARRLQQWNVDRLRLHPDIFADEIKAKRDNRSTYFYELCQGEGAEFFEKVTKAHTQVLVGYLDVRFPNWDEREDDAKYNYFFPAISEKFPQLVKKGAKGKFKYPDGPKVAAELTRRSGGVARPAPSGSHIGAMIRGVVFGAVILGLMYFGWEYWKEQNAAAGDGKKPLVVAPTPVSSATPAPPVRPAEPPKVAMVPPKREKPEPPKPEPKPATPAPEEKPPVIASTPPAETPATTGVLIASNPFEPLAATAPIPVPAVAAAPPAATPSGRTTVRLTKPTLVVLKFGSSTLPAGRVLPFVHLDGATVKVMLGPDVVAIPTANTDINDDAPPQ